MKTDTHPLYQLTTITCACGNVIQTKSTARDIKVEICSKCHPFFTGKQKLVHRRPGGALQEAVQHKGITRPRAELSTRTVERVLAHNIKG